MYRIYYLYGSAYNRFLYLNVVFYLTGFYYSFDGIICFTIRPTNFWKWPNAKINDTTRTGKKIFGRLRLTHPAPAIEPGGRIELCDQ